MVSRGRWSELHTAVASFTSDLQSITVLYEDCLCTCLKYFFLKKLLLMDRHRIQALDFSVMSAAE